jgi:hypothetical protein
MFEIFSNLEISVAQAHKGDGWILCFHRTFEEEEGEHWDALVEEMEDIYPSNYCDSIS